MPAKKWTPEQRKAASERAKARLAGNTATAERPVAASADPLKDLAALIVQATTKDAEESKILDQFTSLIGRIDFKKHPELRDHPAMQGLLEKAFVREDNIPEADGRVAPGTVRGEGLNAQAVPWTWAHVNFLADKEPDGMFARVKFMPERTQTVIWNGLQVW